MPGERTLPASGRLAGPFAVYLARLVDLAPAVSEVPSLEPAPPWTAWNHQEGGLWPWPDDQDADLNEVDGPGWVDDAGRAARQRLQAGHGEIVIGHPPATLAVARSIYSHLPSSGNPLWLGFKNVGRADPAMAVAALT